MPAVETSYAQYAPDYTYYAVEPIIHQLDSNCTQASHVQHDSFSKINSAEVDG